MCVDFFSQGGNCWENSASFCWVLGTVTDPGMFGMFGMFESDCSKSTIGLLQKDEHNKAYQYQYIYILIVYSTGKLNKFVVKSHIDLPTFWNLLL